MAISRFSKRHNKRGRASLVPKFYGREFYGPEFYGVESMGL